MIQETPENFFFSFFAMLSFFSFFFYIAKTIVRSNMNKIQPVKKSSSLKGKEQMTQEKGCFYWLLLWHQFYLDGPFFHLKWDCHLSSWQKNK